MRKVQWRLSGEHAPAIAARLALLLAPLEVLGVVVRARVVPGGAELEIAGADAYIDSAEGMVDQALAKHADANGIKVGTPTAVGEA